MNKPSRLEGLSQSDAPVLVGHPFAPIGMGEHVRSSFRAFKATGVKTPIRDVYGLQDPHRIGIEEELVFAQTHRLSNTINIFHLNGDEVVQALAHLQEYIQEDAHNIIYPAWELSLYPSDWATELDPFDEVWAPSLFIRESIAPSVSRPVFHMPLACELEFKSFNGRRYFGIPETSYVFLFFFDLTSYVSRKNPQAVLDAFAHLLHSRPGADVRMVVKLNGTTARPDDFKALCEEVQKYGDKVIVIEKVYSDNEVKNLVRCCDCFISLHRSEGFGRGMSEAMFLGKPVIATAYSGNLDYMDKSNSFLVSYRLIPVKKGAYPYWQNQVWADPDIEHAAHYMMSLVDDPRLGREVGKVASRSIRQRLSYRAVGLRYYRRLEEILEMRQDRDKGKGTRDGVDVAEKPSGIRSLTPCPPPSAPFFSRCLLPALDPIAIVESRDRFREAQLLDIAVKLREHDQNLITKKNSEFFTIKGFCDPCNAQVPFIVDMQSDGRHDGSNWIPNWRERLECPRCRMNNRQRLIASLIRQSLQPETALGGAKTICLMEQVTPLFRWAEKEFSSANIIGSEYLGYDYAGGTMVRGIRHEDVMRLSFPDNTIDLIVSTDVFEHVPDPDAGFAECVRVLRPGGTMLMTIPYDTEALESQQRATLVGAEVVHLLEPKYHGNPISADGSLVFTNFGWDVLDRLRKAGFADAVVELYASLSHGHFGGLQSVFRATKAGAGGVRRIAHEKGDNL